MPSTRHSQVPPREPQVRTAPVSPASRVCALSLAAPCAHLSSDLVAGAAQVQSQLRYLKSTSSAPVGAGETVAEAIVAQAPAIAARTHGARPPACLLTCGCILPRCRRSRCSRLCTTRGTMRAHYGADVAAVDAGCADAGCAGCVAVRCAARRDSRVPKPLGGVLAVTLKRLGGVLAERGGPKESVPLKQGW